MTTRENQPNFVIKPTGEAEGLSTNREINPTLVNINFPRQRTQELGNASVQTALHSEVAKTEDIDGAIIEQVLYKPSERRDAIAHIVHIYQDNPTVQIAIMNQRKQPHNYHSTDILDSYIPNASGYKLLTAEQEVELFNDIEEGLAVYKSLDSLKGSLDSISNLEEAKLIRLAAARQIIFNANLGLVVHIVHNLPFWQSELIQPVDLIQEGNIGLSQAIASFDIKYGYKFSTLAGVCIKRRALDYKKAVEKSSSTSLEEMTGDDTPDDVIGEYIVDENNNLDHYIDKISDREQIKIMLDRANLRDREKFVVGLRYGLDPAIVGPLIFTEKGVTFDYKKAFNEMSNGNFPIAKLGRMFGVHESRISQIEKKVLELFRMVRHQQRLQPKGQPAPHFTVARRAQNNGGFSQKMTRN